MKIVQLITRLDVIGGAQNHVAALCSRLKSDGHDVTIITGPYKKELWAFEQESITVIENPFLQRDISLQGDIKAFNHLRKNLKKVKPDLVAIHSSKAGVIGRLAAFSLGIKCVFTAHGWSFTNGIAPIKRRVYKRIEKSLGLLTTKVIAVSEYDRSLAIKEKVIRPKNIVTIHNGITEHTNQTNMSNSSEEPVIVMVARFEQPKRQDLLVEALKNSQTIKWKINFVGEGVNRPIVEELVHKNNLEQRVHFYDSSTNVEKMLGESDIFVLLSDFEGLPISIIEAMRAGLPVVASDVGGVRELVTHNKSGFLIPPHNLTQLNEALVTLLKNRLLVKKMGDFGNREFLRAFTFEKMYSKTAAEYHLIVQSKDERIRKHVNI